MLYGVDIASWQGSPDFARLKAQGHDFMITKVTGEDDYVNPLWRPSLERAAAAGLVVGTYDWIEPQGAATMSGADAARDYLRVLGERKAGHLLCVDFESPGWYNGRLGRAIEPWMREYLYTLRTLAQQPVIVYTAKYFLEETGAADWDWLGSDFLYWQAAPGPDAMMDDDSFWPATSAPFADTLIHQHQWHAKSPAVVGEFDRNRFRGTREDLLAYGKDGGPAVTVAPSPIVTPAQDWGVGSAGTVTFRAEVIAVTNSEGKRLLSLALNGQQVPLDGTNPWKEL